MGDPLDRGTDVGAMIHQSHLDAVLGHIGAGVEQGATVLTGGHRPEAADLAAGAFVVPTVLAGVTERMTPFHDEIFGPVLTTSTFTDAAEAIRLANAVDYGLANSVWSGSIDTALTVYEDWASPDETGVVYYVDGGALVGVLLWNVWDSTDAARALMARYREPGSLPDPSALRGAITAG